MTWRTVVTLACALVVSVSGCSDPVASPASANAERSILVQRARDLKSSITATGSMTDAHRGTLAALMRDVYAWQAATGRTDIAFTRAGDACDAAAAVSAQITKTAKPPTGVCVPVVVMGDFVCFIESHVNGKCTYACFSSLPEPPSR